jgi:hypothetical protein
MQNSKWYDYDHHTWRKTKMASFHLSGPNGYALPRTVYVNDIEIGTVKPVVHNYNGGSIYWQAVDTHGNSHGDRWLTDFFAAKQLLLALRLTEESR